MQEMIIYYVLSLSVILQVVILYKLWQGRIGFAHRDVLLEEGKAKTSSMLHRAIQQANKILITAELKGIQLISKQKLTGNDLTREFNSHLSTIEKALSQQLIRNAEHAEQSYNEFIATAEKTIKDHIVANEKMLGDKSTAMVAQTEALLGEFTRDLEKRVKEDIEKQMKEATGEIEQYKLTRMRVLDERIVDVLEEVLQAVLEKKLTINDQSDLVYKALEQAKKEHAFNDKRKTS